MAKTSGRSTAAPKAPRTRAVKVAEPAKPAAPVKARRSAEHVRYGPTTVKKICDLLAEGKSWSHVAGDEGLPSYPTFYVWLRTHPEFAEAVEAARAAGALACMDEAQHVANTATKEDLAQARLKVGTLLRRASLMKAGGASRGAASAGRRQVVIYVRRFRVVEDEAGVKRVEEVVPEHLK